MMEYLIIILASTVFGIQHSGISALRVKNWIIDKYGKPGYANIFKITSILSLSLAFLSMNFWNWLYFIISPSLIQIIPIVSGAVTGIFGVIIAMKASSVISVSTVADMRTDREAELVTDGIYSKVRHPLYLATILIFGAMAMIYPFSRVILFAVCMILYTLIGAYLEERKLIVHYGEDYLAYKKEVGFILPRF
ncbi:isoprenylcysteine carboxylmethyltransferase family protein [Candidatus Thorarchaeota archaeon]|nr:MAG: isoprenylcysteine carboxylmethyltransferase family protein [Candidatus Thorarchaeota archaeon]